VVRSTADVREMVQSKKNGSSRLDRGAGVGDGAECGAELEGETPSVASDRTPSCSRNECGIVFVIFREGV